MKRPVRTRLAATLALAAVTSASTGCYAGYGGHTGYGGYTRASTTSCYRGNYRYSGGAEEFLVYAAFYGGVVIISGVIEFVEWVRSECG